MANSYNNSYSQRRIRKIVRRFGLIPMRSEPVASFYRKNAILRVQTESGTYAMKPFSRSVLLRSGTIDQIKATAENRRFRKAWPGSCLLAYYLQLFLFLE